MIFGFHWSCRYFWTRTFQSELQVMAILAGKYLETSPVWHKTATSKFETSPKKHRPTNQLIIFGSTSSWIFKVFLVRQLSNLPSTLAWNVAMMLVASCQAWQFQRYWTLDVLAKPFVFWTNQKQHEMVAHCSIPIYTMSRGSPMEFALRGQDAITSCT